MKRSSFLVSFALLGVISFIVWGCGGWFAHKNDRQQTAKTADIQQNPVATVPSSTTAPVFTDEAPNIADAGLMKTKEAYLDTPRIIRSDSPIRDVCHISGRYNSGWRVSGNSKKMFPPDEFMDRYVLPNIGISDINELRLSQKRERDKDGYEYWDYIQYHKGLPTTHSFTLTLKDGMAGSFHSYFEEAMDIDIVPTISEMQAWDSIKAFLASTDTRTAFPNKYRGVLDFNTIKEFPYPQEIINGMTYQVQLVIESANSINPAKKGQTLMYKFELRHDYYIFEPTVFIDADDGTVVLYGSGNYCNHTATVDTKYGFPGQTYYNQSFCVENNGSNLVQELNK